MIRQFLLTLAVFASFLFLPTLSKAAIVLTYTGNPYNTLADLPFTSADFITGTATFNNIGDTTATSVTLTTTLGGSAGFSITNSGAVGVFSWSGNSLSSWNVSVFDSVYAVGGFQEDLTISDMLGDQATIDLLSPTQRFGVTFDAGSWSSATAVPEPGSFVVFAASLLGAGIYRRRCRAS